MDKVTRIYWTFETSNAQWSGTDDLVTMRIFRDGHRLVWANVEPGNTTRLDRGERQTYYLWEKLQELENAAPRATKGGDG